MPSSSFISTSARSFLRRKNFTRPVVVTRSPGLTLPVNSTLASVNTVTSFSTSAARVLLRVEIDPQRHDAGLGHGLDEDHTRRDRIAGEVTAIEVLVLPETCSSQRCARVELEDLVDESEGLLLGHHREHLLGRELATHRTCLR